MLRCPFDPFPAWQTPRLRLRRLRADDAPALFALHSNPDVNRYLGRQPPADESAALEQIARLNAGIREGVSMYWVLADPQDRLLGTCCLWHFEPEAGRVELGYELHPDAQGRGLMREAVALVLAFAFREMEAQAVEAWVHRANSPSVRLLEHFGYAPDPVQEQRHADLPELRFMRIYALERATWELAAA